MTKPNSLNYAYFRDMLIRFEYYILFEIFYTDWHDCSKQVNFVKYLWLHMSMLLLYLSRLYLILLGDINRALA